MGDAFFVIVMLTAFALTVGLVQVLGRLIETGGRDNVADGPPDAGSTQMVLADRDVTGRGGPR